MENRKRKRDPEADAPRIKYHVEQLGRSFERILKEDSQEELRKVVRKKLNLDDTTRLELVQLRDGRLYDLEDDDDFEAFKAAAVAYSSLDVRVTYMPQNLTGSNSHVDGPSGPVASTSRTPLNLEKGSQGPDKGPISAPKQSLQDGGIVNSPSADEEDPPAPPKKKRKKDDTAAAADVSQAGAKTKRKITKSKDPEPAPVDQAQAQEPPTKKQKRSKEKDASLNPIKNTSVPVPVDTVPKVKKSKPKKAANEVDAGPSTSQQITSKDKRSRKKDMQSKTPAIPEPTDSTSAPATGLETFPISLVSKINSALVELSRKNSGTATELATSHDSQRNKDVETSKKETTTAAASTKDGKGKAKAPAKARARKSRLSESWVPGEDEDTPSAPRAEGSSRESVRPPPADMTGPAGAVALSSAAATVTSSSSPRRAGRPATPKSLSKQAAASPCPVCLTRPFHLQYECPLIKRGPSDIKERIAELEAEGGWDNLINELNEWLAKTEKQAIKGRRIEFDMRHGVVSDQGSQDANSSIRKTGQRRESRVSIPEWASRGDGQLSEVTVESRNEGSEGEESSSSDSGSEENEEHGDQSNTDSQSDSGSKSDRESPGSSSKKSLSVDLEGVDLEALIRGPAVKVQLATLGHERESDSAEEYSSLLLEEEEERPRRAKGRELERSSSPEGVGDGDDGSEAEPELATEESFAVGEVNDSINNEEVNQGVFSEGNLAVPARSASVEAVIPLNGGPEVQHTSERDTSPVSQGEQQRIEEVGAVVSERLSTPTTDEPLLSMSTAMPQTTPKRPPTPRISSAPRSPLVQQMKDRHGTLPLNPPDDEIGNSFLKSSAVDATSTPDPEPVGERPRGRSSAPSRAKSTARSTRSRSRTAGPASSSASTPAPSESAPKRRGRPPLSEAVKAERKAIRDAEKAARAADKRAAAEEMKKTKKKGSVPAKARKKANDPEAGPPASEVNPPSKSLPPLASQWKTLAPAPSSVVSQSSPAVDQLMTSSPSSQADKALTDHDETVALAVTNGVKSPGAVSVTTSVSRRHDEDDVEQIVGSQKAPKKQKMLSGSRQPLFLPGASQMTQSQPISSPSSQSAEKLRPATFGKSRELDSDSETEAESGEAEKSPKKSMIPRPSLPSKSAFPSLSQLSFQNFKPSFLLPGRAFSQSKGDKQEAKQDAQQLDEESESDDDDDSSDEEKNSHIPKGRLAGSGVVKKRKSRGLLVD